MVQCSRVRWSQVGTWYNVIESGIANQSYGIMQWSQAELCSVKWIIVQYSTIKSAILQCGRVWQSQVQSQVEPWYNVVQSRGALVQCSRVKWSPGAMQKSQVELLYNILQSQVDPMAHARWQSQVQPCYSVIEESSKAMVKHIQCSRVKQSHCTIQQSQVELRRAMQYRVRQNQVEPWQSVLESSGAIIQCSTVKQSHGTIQQSQVEPSRAMLQCCRVMQINWSHGRLQYIESS